MAVWSGVVSDLETLLIYGQKGEEREGRGNGEGKERERGNGEEKERGNYDREGRRIENSIEVKSEGKRGGDRGG